MRYNGHGDVIIVTDVQGDELASYDYDEFGNITDETGEFDNPYRYAGYEYVEELKLYDLKARMYDPDTGRFLSEDPYFDLGNRIIGVYEVNVPDVWSIMQGNNLYAYCGGNPVLFIDPSGLIGIMPDGSIYMDEGDTELDKELLELKIEYEKAGNDIEKNLIAQKAKELRAANPKKGAYKVLAEHSIDDYYIPDLTEIMNTFMMENVLEFTVYSLERTSIYKYSWFADQVKTGAMVDVKNSDSTYKREAYSYHIIYNGEVMRADAPGNIFYGFLGKSAGFSEAELLYGAGLYQIYSDGKDAGKLTVFAMEWDRIFDNYGDKPGDPEQIKYGINLRINFKYNLSNV